MGATYDPKTIENILSGADELLNRLNSGLIKDLEETERIQIEIMANNLKKQKIEVQEKIEMRKPSKHPSFGEGIHEAIEDILKAMRDLTSYLT